MGVKLTKSIFPLSKEIKFLNLYHKLWYNQLTLLNLEAQIKSTMNILSNHKRKLFVLATVSLFAILAMNKLSAQTTTTVVVKNTSDKDIVDYTVELPVNKVHLSLGNYVALSSENEQVPIELIKDVCDNTRLVFPVSRIGKNTEKTFVLKLGEAIQYPKRTYAELSHKIGGEFVKHGEDKKNRMEYIGGYAWVKPNYLRIPDGFTDHAYYIKYEGPGWESDKVAFRFYLDWRNGIDVFAKKTPGIVLPQVGIDGYDNYHKMADWGMDNMKVGSALGLGSIAIWDGTKAVRVEKTDSVICYIPADGKVRSQVMTNYYGWEANGVKCDLKALISIDAGSRASHMELSVDKDLDNLATGINKDKNAEFFKSDNSGEWSYIGSFGKQSLNNDMMGLVIFYRTKQLKEIAEDQRNHVVVLKPENGKVDYYFMPTWELDWEPVVTKSDLQKCIDEVMNRLNSEIIITTK